MKLFAILSVAITANCSFMDVGMVKHARGIDRELVYVQQPVLDCDLNFELYPMYYTPVTRSSSFRMAFDSNCFSRKEVSFEVYYPKDDRVNWNYHPTVINLLLWGNWYRIIFYKPRIVDRWDVMRSLEYTKATIFNLEKEVDIDLLFENQTPIPQQSYKSFTPENMSRITKLGEFFGCIYRPRKVFNFQILERQKQVADQMNRENGVVIEDPILMAEHIPSQPFPPHLKDLLNFKPPNRTVEIQNKTAINPDQVSFDNGLATVKINNSTANGTGSRNTTFAVVTQNTQQPQQTQTTQQNQTGQQAQTSPPRELQGSEFKPPADKPLNQDGSVKKDDTSQQEKLTVEDLVYKSEFAPTQKFAPNLTEDQEEVLRQALRKNTLLKLKKDFIEELEVMCDIK